MSCAEQIRTSSESIRISSEASSKSTMKRRIWLCVALLCASLAMIILGVVLMSKIQQHNCIIQLTYVESSLCEKYDYTGDGNRVDKGLGICYNSYANCDYSTSDALFYCDHYHLDSGEQSALLLQLQQQFPNGTSVNVFTFGAPSRTENHCNPKRSSFQEGPIISIVLGSILAFIALLGLLMLYGSSSPNDTRRVHDAVVN